MNNTASLTITQVIDIDQLQLSKRHRLSKSFDASATRTATVAITLLFRAIQAASKAAAAAECSKMQQQQ